VALVPLRCHHCYAKSYRFWPLTWGQQLDPPPRPEPSTTVSVLEARVAERGRNGGTTVRRRRVAA